MNATMSKSVATGWSPVAVKNPVGEWLLAILFAAGSCWLVMAYHAWWRAKPYSWLTFNESLAHTAYYCLALAYVCGPLYRFGLLPARAVLVRRPFGIVGVVCAILHVGVTLGPLWGEFGWNYFLVQHWDLTALGVVCLALAVWMLQTSLGGAPQQMGVARWFRVQLLGLALLPLVLWHFMALGKVGKWLDWFHGVDTKPAPAGTLIIFAVGVLVIALRLVDAVRHAPSKCVRMEKN
jgi:hypothetical protein